MAVRGFGTRLVSREGRDEESDRQWVKAIVFVPGRRAHCPDPLYPSYLRRMIRTPPPKHDDSCHVCGISPISPWNRREKANHIIKCLADREKHFEIRKSIEESRDKECLICFEKILATQNPSKIHVHHSFGLLSNCDHVFCLPCIRTWRSNRSIANYMSCPYCRTHSDFVLPSVYYVGQEAKQELLDQHIDSLRRFKALTMGLYYVFDEEEDEDEEQREFREAGHSFTSERLVYGVSIELMHLATVSKEHWLCVEEELEKVKVDLNNLRSGFPLIDKLVHLKKTVEDYHAAQQLEKLRQQGSQPNSTPQEDEQGSSEQADEQVSSEQDDEQVSSDQDDEQVSSEQDDEQVSSEQDDQQVSSRRDDQQVSQQNDQHAFSQRHDQQVTSQRERQEVLSQRDDQELSSQRDRQEVLSQRDDQELSSQRDRQEVLSQRDDQELSSQRDRQEVLSQRDDQEVSSQRGSQGVSSRQDGEQVSSQRDGREVWSEGDDQQASVQQDNKQASEQNSPPAS